jgi:hypothetical protein
VLVPEYRVRWACRLEETWPAGVAFTSHKKIEGIGNSPTEAREQLVRLLADDANDWQKKINALLKDGSV